MTWLMYLPGKNIIIKKNTVCIFGFIIFDCFHFVSRDVRLNFFVMDFFGSKISFSTLYRLV